MSFITKEDYGSHIADNRLDAMSGYDDSKLPAIEGRAIAFVKGYLNARFDTDTIFATTGGSRDAQILAVCIDVVVYYVARLVAPRNISNTIKEAYQESKEWLEGVMSADINPPGLAVPSDGTKAYVTFGGNTKRENHI